MRGYVHLVKLNGGGGAYVHVVKFIFHRGDYVDVAKFIGGLCPPIQNSRGRFCLGGYCPYPYCVPSDEQ